MTTNCPRRRRDPASRTRHVPAVLLHGFAPSAVRRAPYHVDGRGILRRAYRHGSVRNTLCILRVRSRPARDRLKPPLHRLDHAADDHLCRRRKRPRPGHQRHDDLCRRLGLFVQRRSAARAFRLGDDEPRPHSLARARATCANVAGSPAASVRDPSGGRMILAMPTLYLPGTHVTSDTRRVAPQHHISSV